MHLRDIGIGAITIVALAAIAPVNASAFPPTTTANPWLVGASHTELVGSRTIQLTSIGTSKLVSKVGASLTPIELTSTEGECVGCTIENNGGSAFGTGRVLFKNVVVTTPAHCKAVSEAGVSGQVLTKSLNVHADLMVGVLEWDQQLTPAAGEKTSFSPLHLENNGGTCAAAGLYSITGTLYARAVHPTGQFSGLQDVEVSPALEEHWDSGLFIGSQKAELTAAASFSLTGGEEFAVK